MVFFYDQGIPLLVGIVLETGKRGSPSIASLSERMNDASQFSMTHLSREIEGASAGIRPDSVIVERSITWL